MQNPDMFKNAMIQKMTGPDAISASILSKEVDVPQATLSKWLRGAGIGSGGTSTTPQPGATENDHRSY